MRTVVVYYSRFGHTARIASALAQELGAELREIRAEKEHGYPVMGFGGVFNLRFRIKPMDFSFKPFDPVVLCTPIWASRPACPVRTFLDRARLEGKSLALVFSGLSGEMEKPLETVRGDVQGKEVVLGPVKSLITKGLEEESLRSFVRQFAAELRSRFPA